MRCMKLDPPDNCPNCGEENIKLHKTYETKHNRIRDLYKCKNCNHLFSAAIGTPMEGLKTLISKITSVIRVRSKGLGQ